MKTKAILSIAAALLAASCSIYHPQAVDIPLVDHQGEWRVDAAAAVSTFLIVPDAATVGATATYGITPWLSAQVHANYGGGSNFYLQAAPGAYSRLGEKAVVEGFIGVGYGGSGYDSKKGNENSNEGSSSHYSYRGTYLLPFAQLNFGWRRLGPVELAAGIKAGLMMPDYDCRYFDSNGIEKTERYSTYSTLNALLEPQLQFRIGSDRVKYTLRLGYAWLSDMDNSDGNANNGFIHDFLTISNGLTFSF